MWIPINDEEAPTLIKQLKNGGFPDLAATIDQAMRELQHDDTQKLIAAAEEKYGRCNDFDEINVDGDAAISTSDEHAFVMMWGCVTFEEAGISTEEDADTNEESDD